MLFIILWLQKLYEESHDDTPEARERSRASSSLTSEHRTEKIRREKRQYDEEDINPNTLNTIEILTKQNAFLTDKLKREKTKKREATAYALLQRGKRKAEKQRRLQTDETLRGFVNDVQQIQSEADIIGKRR